MKTIYAVVFNTGIVKFGRTRNLHKRTYEHATVGKHHGANALFVFSALVGDEVAMEQSILSRANYRLNGVSGESFMAKSLESISSCFKDLGLDFFIFEVGQSPFSLSLSQITFENQMPSYIPAGTSKVKKTPEDRVRDKVLSVLLDNREGIFINEIKPHMNTERVRDIESCIDRLIESGEVIMFFPRTPMGSEVRLPRLRKVKLAR